MDSRTSDLDAIFLAHGLPALTRSPVVGWAEGFVEDDTELAAYQAKWDRKFARDLAVLQARVSRALDGQSLEGHDGHFAMPWGQATLASAVVPSPAARRLVFARLADAIKRVKNAPLRAELRRELRRLTALIARRLDDVRSTATSASIPVVAVHSAGGKTDRFAQRD